MAPLLSRRDLDFLLYEWLDVEALTHRPRFAEHNRESFDAMLNLSEHLAAKHFAPHNKKSDANEPRMRTDGTIEMIEDVRTALDAFNGSGLLSADFDDAVGGLQLPTTVARAAFVWFQAANTSTSNYPFLTMANARLLAKYGSEQQIADYVVPLLQGRYFGTMCLSEPQAGSALADITTRAIPQDDGTYRVTGTKMWISGGEHDLAENIVHLVLAKAPGGAPGVKGISLFVVPKNLPASEPGQARQRNDVALVGLNHKMGMRGTTNTVLAFGSGAHRPDGCAGAIGYLVGSEHHGLSYMFAMMNEARIGVAFSAAALGYTGFLKSLEYAKIRAQGRRPGTKDPTSSPVTLIEHVDVRRMLLAQKCYVEGSLALLLYCSALVDEIASTRDHQRAADAELLLDLLTPIAKSWCSQWCLEANSLAIQILGGAGYTRDYDVEQHYRDNRLNPIHEGTHGIQAIDLLGRKVSLDGGRGFALLGARVQETVDRAARLGSDAAECANQLQATWSRIVAITNQLASVADPETALANATAYLEAVGHAVLAWIWLEQFIVANAQQGDFYQGKRQAARFFFACELPRVGPQLDLLASIDTTAMKMDPAWF